jgi:NADH dehydrogenase (ubiquinone) Fe-S protein 7
MALRSMFHTLVATSKHPPSTDHFPTAKPATALMPFRAAQTAWISSSSSSKAKPVTQSPGLVSTGPGAPLSAKKNRQEVVLPSQEGKKGLAQYALCVLRVV